MTEQELRKIEARATTATPGPWGITREELGEDFSDVEQMTAFPRSIGPIVSWEPRDTGWSDESIRQIEADAAFIAHARTDVPALVAEVRRLHAALTSARDSLRTWEEAERGGGAEETAVLAARGAVLGALGVWP